MDGGASRLMHITQVMEGEKRRHSLPSLALPRHQCFMGRDLENGLGGVEVGIGPFTQCLSCPSIDG